MLLHVAIGFIIQKEKKPVFLDGPTDGTAKNVAIQKLRYVRFSALQLGRFQEIVVGAEIGIAVVFISGTMKAVGTTLGDQGYLRATGNPFIGVGVARGHTEFLNRVQRDGQHGLERITPFWIHRDAVQRDVALIATRAVNCAAARIRVGVYTWIIAGVDYAGLQGEKIADVATFQRQLLDLVFAEGRAEGSIRGVEGFR